MTRARAMVVAAFAIASAAAAARDAAAQSPVQSGRLELSAGAAWMGRETFGSADAAETTPSGGAFRIFSTSTELGSVPAFDARVGVRVAGTLVAEADASYGRPELRTTISNDVESAPPVTAVERVQQFTIGGGATWYVPAAMRIVPFVSGGGGYLRQLHEGALLVETGTYYQVGGGVAYLFGSGTAGRVKLTGVRVEVRAMTTSGGVAFDGGRHTAPAVAASLFVRF
jgi:hypothetical protein